jgi:hypothetical protein
MLLALLCPVAAEEEWEKDCGTSRPWAGAARLSHEIGTLNLINGLHLSDAQMNDIIGLAREAQRVREGHFERHQARARELAAVLEELKAVLERADARIPKECERRVHVADHALKEVQATYHERLERLEQRLVSLLTEGQREVIRTFNQCLIPPQELKNPVRAGQAAGEYGEIEMHLGHLRNLPARPFGVLMEPLLEKMLDEWTPVLKLTPEMRRAEATRLRELLDTARALDDAEFALRRTELAAEVMQPFTSLRAKATEIGDFFSRFTPLSKPGKWLLNPRVVPLLESKLAARRTAKAAGVQVDAAQSCDDPNVCGEYGASAADAGVCRCGKPTYAGFCNRVGVAEEQREACRRIIARGQIDMLEYLCKPTADGHVPLAEMFVNPQGFGRLLGQAPADGGQAYFARLATTKMRIHRQLKERLDQAAFGKFSRSGIDVFEVHVGNLNRLG